MEQYDRLGDSLSHRKVFARFNNSLISTDCIANVTEAALTLIPFVYEGGTVDLRQIVVSDSNKIFALNHDPEKNIASVVEIDAESGVIAAIPLPFEPIKLINTGALCFLPNERSIVFIEFDCMSTECPVITAVCDESVFLCGGSVQSPLGSVPFVLCANDINSLVIKALLTEWTEFPLEKPKEFDLRASFTTISVGSEAFITDGFEIFKLALSAEEIRLDAVLQCFSRDIELFEVNNRLLITGYADFVTDAYTASLGECNAFLHTPGRSRETIQPVYGPEEGFEYLSIFTGLHPEKKFSVYVSDMSMYLVSVEHFEVLKGATVPVLDVFSEEKRHHDREIHFEKIDVVEGTRCALTHGDALVPAEMRAENFVECDVSALYDMVGCTVWIFLGDDQEGLLHVLQDTVSSFFPCSRAYGQPVLRRNSDRSLFTQTWWGVCQPMEGTVMYSGATTDMISGSSRTVVIDSAVSAYDPVVKSGVTLELASGPYRIAERVIMDMTAEIALIASDVDGDDVFNTIALENPSTYVDDWDLLNDTLYVKTQLCFATAVSNVSRSVYDRVFIEEHPVFTHARAKGASDDDTVTCTLKINKVMSFSSETMVFILRRKDNKVLRFLIHEIFDEHEQEIKNEQDECCLQ
ncbi:hypothetical protein PCE1_003102 [Barthelona sp. PCE]